MGVLVAMLKRSVSRVECVGPKCGIVVSMVTAESEGWVRITQSSGQRLTPRKDRTHIAWCSRCARTYGVEK